MPTEIRVLTLNVLNVADRWPERLPLLQAGFAALRPDMAGLQEVFYPIDQDRLIADGTGPEYVVRRAWADRHERGNSLLLRRALGADLDRSLVPERLALGYGRSALRVVLGLTDCRIQVAVTHLHHVPADEPIRDRQVAQLVAWLQSGTDVDGTIVTGDFNAEPDEVAARRMIDAGYRSAFAEAAGRDPAITFPSGLQAPGREYYVGWPEGCLDYVWISGRIRATAARRCFEAPSPSDPTLYASDHVGILADLVVG